MISREHSALILRSDGEYLVRESASVSGQYCLVFRINGILKNYILTFNGSHYSVGDKKFEKLSDLVEDGLIHLFIETKAKHYIETMSKTSVYAHLKAQDEEIDARGHIKPQGFPSPAPYAEIPLDMSHYMTSSSSGKSSMESYSDNSYSDSGRVDPIYEVVSDEDESLIAHRTILTSSLASKSSISNMSTGQSSECSSSDSYQTSPSSSPTHQPVHCSTQKKKRGLMTSLKRSLSFSRKHRSTKNSISNTPTGTIHSHSKSSTIPNYEKSHDFKVILIIALIKINKYNLGNHLQRQTLLCLLRKLYVGSDRTRSPMWRLWSRCSPYMFPFDSTRLSTRSKACYSTLWKLISDAGETVRNTSSNHCKFVHSRT